jgi:hypothetical protein
MSFVKFPSVAVFGQIKDAPLNDSKKNIIESENATHCWKNTYAISQIPNLAVDHASGLFGGLHNDTDNKTWITTGRWDFISRPSGGNDPDRSYESFNGSIDMRTTDNSEGHGDRVSDFKCTKGTFVTASDGNGTVLTISGTTTIKTPSGENKNIPITIKIIDKGSITYFADPQANKINEFKWKPEGGTISLLIDNPKLTEHFGSTPLYGTVRKG